MDNTIYIPASLGSYLARRVPRTSGKASFADGAIGAPVAASGGGGAGATGAATGASIPSTANPAVIDFGGDLQQNSPISLIPSDYTVPKGRRAVIQAARCMYVRVTVAGISGFLQNYIAVTRKGGTNHIICGVQKNDNAVNSSMIDQLGTGPIELFEGDRVFNVFNDDSSGGGSNVIFRSSACIVEYDAEVSVATVQPQAVAQFSNAAVPSAFNVSAQNATSYSSLASISGGTTSYAEYLGAYQSGMWQNYSPQYQAAMWAALGMSAPSFSGGIKPMTIGGTPTTGMRRL